jgi:glycosyltransferase involved in cell wall biosynthesis
MKKNNISILVPTRNRQETALYAIQSCIECHYENKQIVVCDNSDDDHLKNELIKKGWLDKLIYHKNESVLSMRENWEKGLSLTTGDLVAIMGDDDAILPDAMEIANFAFQNLDIDVLNGSTALYKWGSYPYQGRRQFLSFSMGEKITVNRNPKETLRKAFNYEVLPGTGPGLYYGFVKRSFLEEVKSIRGRYIVDDIPDFDSGYVTLLYAKAYATSARPLFIQGHSAKSNSGSMRFAGMHSENMKTFIKESNTSSEDLFSGSLSKIKSNNSVIVSAQFRFLEESQKYLSDFSLEINKKSAWRYILKGLSEGYDVVEFLASLPALKSLAHEWDIPYTINDKFEPNLVDVSLFSEQGFVKYKSQDGQTATDADAGYGSVVVNGESLGFKTIMDACKHVSAVFPTMRAAPNAALANSAIERHRQLAIDKINKIEECLNQNNSLQASLIFDEILSLGELGLDLDTVADLVYAATKNYEAQSRYYARRFSENGDKLIAAKLYKLYKLMGNLELADAFATGLIQVKIITSPNELI